VAEDPFLGFSVLRFMANLGRLQRPEVGREPTSRKTDEQFDPEALA